MNLFEERRQQRIQRYLELAEKHQQEAEKLHNSEAIQTLRDMMGEPVKIGHHSERRHRRLIKKADRDMQKSIEHWKKAEYYREKAEAVEKNNAIYSDDPDAIEKLEAKLAKLMETHEWMKKINAEYRKCKGDIEKMNVDDATKEKLRKAKEEHEAHNYSWPFKPFEDYVLRNSNSNIKRIKARIEELKQKKQDVTTEKQVVEGVTIIDNVEENRVQIIFDSIPSEEIRKRLKERGFRWSRKNQAWQRIRSKNALYWAEQIVKQLS